MTPEQNVIGIPSPYIINVVMNMIGTTADPILWTIL